METPDQARSWKPRPRTRSADPAGEITLQTAGSLGRRADLLADGSGWWPVTTALTSMSGPGVHEA
ncbi:hypothetical protein ACFW1A_35610 [Kitasatospora sp. NPDC058965]|uniref:hypothetical protein n=1 Tax=Kitasatospora sp. NPDC058965 TaxID=3346682 RepID=UPI0036BF9E6A